MKETADNHRRPLQAPPLAKGDTIGLIAPAGPILDEDTFSAGVRLIREMGFEIKFSRTITRRDGYLAGTDQERSDEFNSLWSDPEIKALIAVRGGYGSIRMLPGIDMERIRQQPKILVGFSDISSLLAAIYRATGLITFHGPMVTTLPTSGSSIIEHYFLTLTGRAPDSIKPAGLEILSSGSTRGTLLGGNLTNLVHLLATPHEVNWTGAVLLLEDIGEAAYRVDRLLTHLAAAGRLRQIAGLILGSFKDCGDVEIIWKRSLELFGGLDIPIWANFPAGHAGENYLLPLGVEVEMDAGQGKLRILGRSTR